MSDPAFINTLLTRWEELRNSVITRENIGGIIDSIAVLLDDAKDRNFDIWPLNEQLAFNYYVFETYKEEVDFLKDWISERITWMDMTMLGYEVEPNYDTSSIEGYQEEFSCYPNPFANHINIDYTLSKQIYKINLKVYNLLGQEVCNVKYKSQPKGEYNFIWNGRDEFGNELANGIYFCQFMINNNPKETIKLIKLNR